jgi:hypothetical protein
MSDDLSKFQLNPDRWSKMGWKLKRVDLDHSSSQPTLSVSEENSNKVVPKKIKVRELNGFYSDYFKSLLDDQDER